ncbi:hypothetical protein J3B02_002799 [Coemansia erecta]|nr:hypothetical protein J3B02_002799 [Coemansia erecta]KAJ2879452.1 hypothetical protein FB639_003083 [Coemansia asiatica]
MSLVTLSSEDCEMIERCVDMISMQCKMIANLLRRSRGTSGAVQDNSRVEANLSDGGEGTVDMLNSAMSALSSSMRQVSSEAGVYSDQRQGVRKRSRGRPYAMHGDGGGVMSGGSEDMHVADGSYLHATTTPPAVKRRGRPPRDYGDELGPAFAMYASEVYAKTMQDLLDRMDAPAGTRLGKSEVLRAVWDSWWLSSQALKDKYLSLARHEMSVNEANMIEILLDYPLPGDASTMQTATRVQNGPVSASASHHAQSPEPASDAFDAYVREQVPLLRAKVPDWSDAEVQRRLLVNWNGLPASERERYETAARVRASGVRPEGTASATSTPARPAAHSAPRRAYVLFCRKERPLLVSGNPEWDLPTVNKELGRRWKELSSADKETYHEMERREAEQRSIARSGSAAAIAATRDSSTSGPSGSNGPALAPRPGQSYSRPGGYFGVMSSSSTSTSTPSRGGPNPNKGPSKAYVFYSRLNRKRVTAENPDWDLATINRELGRMWKTLPPDERQAWEARTAEGDGSSAASTPAHRASPAAPPHLTLGLAPSPVPMPGASAAASIPATPASETATPTPTPTSAHAARIHGLAADEDVEGEAEDVDMHDDETDSESAMPTGMHSRPMAAATGAASIARPPPTAKPAVIVNAAATPSADSTPLSSSIDLKSTEPLNRTPESQ